MSWFRKLLPPKIKREGTAQKKAVPEGLWSKCPSCEAVLYFTDLEQATEGGDQAWDIAMFVYYQTKLSFKDSGAGRVADAFLKGYRRANGAENILKAMSPKYVSPFRPITSSQVLNAVKESMDANSS